MPIVPENAKQYARGYEHFGGVAAELTSQSQPAWTAGPQAAKKSPNVILMLVDDMGFSDIGPFGGEISTPYLESLADDGYRMTNYRTAAMCSPARASLLTGLNPHRAGFGMVAHADPGYPGSTLEISDDVPTIAESFQAGGYATFLLGKWHLTKESHMNDGADKSSWPLQRGFDRYFGSMDGFTTFFQPHRLVCDNSPVIMDDYSDDYYLTDDLTDRAIGMIKGLRSSNPEKPFFLYFAHQAVHAPLQAKPQDIEKYRGLYACGWDHIRDERFRRQIQQGLFPESTNVPGRETTLGSEVHSWDSLSSEQQLLFARYMEVYAAMIDNIDQNLGRLIEYLKRIDEYDNTIIAFTSDNGATGEGGPSGTRSYFSQFLGFETQLPEQWNKDVPRDPELIGGPRTLVHYPRGWAYASNTPFRYYKRHTFEGGVHAPLLISWPEGLPRKAADHGIRNHFTYVSDLGLTLLELAGIDHLEERHGLQAKEVDGLSFVDILKDHKATAFRNSQYAEMMGNRALYKDGWKIVTNHRPGDPFSDEEWELYDMVSDPTETTNLAAHHPEIVREMAEQWRQQAWHNTVFPLEDNGSYNVRPSTELILERPVTIYPGTPTLERYRSRKLTNMRDFEIEVSLHYQKGFEGVIVSHGDQGGGYVLYVEDGNLCFSYNQYGEMHRESTPITGEGEYKIRVAFETGPDLLVDITISVEEKYKMALQNMLQLIGMCPFTGISVGVDRGSPVDWELFERHRSFAFTSHDLEVRYVPGELASYNQETIVQIEQAAELIFE